MHIHGRRYDTGEAVRVEAASGRIARVEAAGHGAGQAWPWLAPGFVDIQVNGYGGQEFSSLGLSAEKVDHIVQTHYGFGVTGLCPTLTTAGFDVLRHGMRAIAAACEGRGPAASGVVGIHLEGPYFSPEDGPRGAHPAEHCRRPDWDEFQRLQEAAGGRIVLLTMSPEFDEAPDFIAKAVASGVIVAIGHTAADAAHLRRAVDSGAALSTHLGNGAHRMLRRHPNYLWDQLAEDRLMASLIVDGHHLPPEVVQTFVRAKTAARIILVSDVSGLAGLAPGRYPASGCEVEVLPDGRLVIAGQDQLLAGASRPIGDGVANVMRFAGVDLPTAVAMATCRPADLLRRRCGGLRPGDPADLVLFDLAEGKRGGVCGTLAVRATVALGKLVFGSLVPAGGAL
jgi:N-acetylglucosamine-6-phosphate deacetylase